MTTRHHKNNADLLADARSSLLGNLNVAVWSLLLFSGIELFINGFSQSFSFQSPFLTLAVSLAAQIVTGIFAGLFRVGLSSVFLLLQYGREARVGSLFVCFRENQDTSVRVRAFLTFGECLMLLPFQLLLFLSPDLFKELPLPALLITVLSFGALMVWKITFAMADFVLLDFPELGARRILHTARSMMRGSRLRYFLLMLRIVPLHLLGILSFGITMLWTGSYQQAASAAFYKDLLSAE